MVLDLYIVDMSWFQAVSDQLEGIIGLFDEIYLFAVQKR
jgi:hypothetical protein